MIRVLGEQFFIMIVDLNDYRLLTIFLTSLVIMLGASEIGRLIFAGAARDIAAARSSRRLVAAVTYSEIIRSVSTFYNRTAGGELHYARANDPLRPCGEHRQA
jgi:hypothetical protein